MGMKVGAARRSENRGFDVRLAKAAIPSTTKGNEDTEKIFVGVGRTVLDKTPHPFCMT